MQTPKLHAGYHKLAFRPNKNFTTTEGTVNRITTQLFNIPLSMFERRSSGKAPQYLETLTYNRMIDLTYKNSTKYGTCLDRVTIQGSAFDYMTFNTEFIRQYLQNEQFQAIELHSKVDVPHTVIDFRTIKEHFVSHAYVAPGCKQVVPLCDPSNDYAETYYAGRRSTHRILRGRKSTRRPARHHTDRTAAFWERCSQLLPWGLLG
jgi:hypothetical protein